MRYLETHYPEGGFVKGGAPAGEFAFPDFSINGGSTRWFLGSPSFGKAQYAAVADDAKCSPAFIDESTEAVRKYYPGIPRQMLDRMVTSMLLALAKEAPPAGTVFRVYVEPDTAKLQYMSNQDKTVFPFGDRFVVLWETSPFANNQQ